MTAAACAVLGAALLTLPYAPAERLRTVLPSARSPERAAPRRRRHALGGDLAAVAVGGLVALLTFLIGAGVLAALAGVGAGFGFRRLRTHGERRDADPLAMAVAGDLLAACLRSGMPVPTAVRAVAPAAHPDAADALRATADLLALGAEPREAWEPARRCSATTELANAACRTSRSGSALAGVAEDMAGRARAAVADLAEERAQRAGVLVAGPLGLCFLPAFLCLGIAPVVIGIASQLSF